MRILYFSFLILLFSCHTSNDISAESNYQKKDFEVKGQVKGILSKTVYLTSFYGHKTTLIDSASVNSSGEFIFNIDQKHPIGLYRIRMGQNLRAQFMGGGEQFVDLIFNYEDIEFKTHFDFPFDSMNIIKSNENKLYYDYILKNDENKRKLELLYRIVQEYPKTDAFYKDLIKQYNKVQKDNNSFSKNLISKNKGSFLSKIIAFDMLPIINLQQTPEERDRKMKEAFFGENDFNDTILLYSDLIPSKVIRYLSLYRNEGYSQEMQEGAFINAIDIVMGKIGTNESIHNNVLDYLIEGFERFGMESVLLHLYDHYILGNSCIDNEKTVSLKEKTEAIKRMGKGQPAPHFIIKDIDNNDIDLNKIEAEFTLVLFWASWCSHCTTVIPELLNLYNNTSRDKLEIIAISLDTKKADWEQYLKHQKTNWINHASLKGWDCPTARSYFIYATPSLILLDRDKNILGKPLSARDLRSYLF